MKNDNKGYVFWFTGRPGSGKSTLITKLEPLVNKVSRFQLLEPADLLTWVPRKYLTCRINQPIDITIKSAKRLSECGIHVLCSHSAPAHLSRLRIKKILRDKYVEIFVKCSEETCRNRISIRPRMKFDKYHRQRGFRHLISYEEPTSPDLIIDSQKKFGK